MSERQRGSEARADEVSGVAGVTRASPGTRQDGVGLGEGVTAERDLASVPPANDGGVLTVRRDKQGTATLVSSASGVNDGRRR